MSDETLTVSPYVWAVEQLGFWIGTKQSDDGPVLRVYEDDPAHGTLVLMARQSLTPTLPWYDDRPREERRIVGETVRQIFVSLAKLMWPDALAEIEAKIQARQTALHAKGREYGDAHFAVHQVRWRGASADRDERAGAVASAA